MQNSSKQDQKKEAAANQATSLTKQTSPKAAGNLSDSKGGTNDKNPVTSRNQGGSGQASKETIQSNQ